MTTETVSTIMMIGMIGVVIALIKNTNLGKRTHSQKTNNNINIH